VRETKGDRQLHFTIFSVTVKKGKTIDEFLEAVEKFLKEWTDKDKDSYYEWEAGQHG
jgi:hypothetical protein